MACLSPITYTHYFTWNRLYVIKRTGGDLFKLRIFNVAREILFRFTFSKEALNAENKVKNVEVLDVPSLLMHLGKNEWIPACFLPTSFSGAIRDLIEEGKAALHSSVQVPFLQEKVEQNEKLLEETLKLAKLHMDCQKYATALKCYEIAFQYTQESKHYANIPLLFKAMNQPEKTVLSYLYLVSYQLREKRVDEAVQLLEGIHRDRREEKEGVWIKRALIILYSLNGKFSEAVMLAKTLSKIDVQQRIAIYQHLLERHPQAWDLYAELGNIVETPQEKRHVILKGVWHALEGGEREKAEQLWEKVSSTDRFEEDLLYLRIEKERHAALVRGYEERGEDRKALTLYKWVLSQQDHPEYRAKAVKIYTKLKKPECWEKKAKECVSQGQLLSAESFYRKAFFFFPTPNFGFGWIAVLARLNRTFERVSVLFQLAQQMAQENKEEIFYDCLRQISSLDPSMDFLSAEQKESLTQQQETFEKKKAKKGLTYGVRVVQARGGSIDGPGKSGFPPLIKAAKRGWEDGVMVLVIAKASLNVTDTRGQTAVMHAVMNGYDKIVGFLADEKADLCMESSSGMTALMMAVVQEEVPCIAELASPGTINQLSVTPMVSDLEFLQKAWGPSLLLRNFQTFLIESDRIKDLDRYIFSQVQGTTRGYWTQISPLMLAALIGSAKIVSDLIQREALVQKEREDGMDAMGFGAASGSCAVLHLLKRAGGQFQKQGKGFDGFIVAVALGKTAVLDAFMDEEVDVNLVYPGGLTALIFAAQNGHASVVELLLKKGAKIEVCREKFNAFMVAVARGHKEVVRKFLEHHPEWLELRNAAGQTVVDIAKTSLAIEMRVMVTQAHLRWQLAQPRGSLLQAYCDGILPKERGKQD